MNEVSTEKSMNDLLGQATDISGIGVESKGAVEKAAFDLYRETAIVAVASSHLFESHNPDNGALPRNQAIGAGLIVRIAKFMSAVLALLCDKVQEHGEAVMALNRCITESAINLKFFCEKAVPQDFDDFIKSSLRPEKESYIDIQKNISERRETLPIETRMLNSINRVFRISGITGIGELDQIPKRKNYKNILSSLGMGSLYPMFQGIPSHSVHGTWVDLVLHHLDEIPGGFKPRPDSVTADARLLCPISDIVLMAIRSYVGKYFRKENEGILALLARIDNLIVRNKKVDSIHEEQVAK